MKIAFLLTLSIITLYCSPNTIADDEFDVDQADTLDFESFHKPKNNAVKIYNSETQQFFSSSSTSSEKTTSNLRTSSERKYKEEVLSGQTHEIRQRYTVDESEHTTDTANTATNALHKKMARYCPQGWHKQKEWSVPVDGDFYLHYQFRCEE